MAKVNIRHQENPLWTQPEIWCIAVLMSLAMNLVTMPYIASIYMQAQGGSKAIKQEELKLAASDPIKPSKEMGDSAEDEVSVSLTSGSRPTGKDSVINLDQ